MNVLDFTVLVWVGSVVAGFLGALTGLGGGVVIVPLLVLVFKRGHALRHRRLARLGDRHLVGRRCGLSSEGYSNIRIGMFLEIATTLGALAGACAGRP